MLRTLIRSTLLLAVVCVPALRAQAKPRSSDPTAEMTRLENDWTVGLVKRDSALFERLLAPRFVYTENDKLSRRSDVLHDVVAGSDTTTAAHNEGIEVHQFSPTTAVVTGWLSCGAAARAVPSCIATGSPTRG